MTGSLLGVDPATAMAWERAALLLGPLALAGALVILVRPTPREASAAMLAFLWQMPSLLALNVLAAHVGWWSFPDTGGPAVLGLPVDIWVGWAFWWGPVAALLEKRCGIPALLAGAAAFDAAGMPLLSCVSLSVGWLWGEPVFVAFGLLPGLLFARWTRTDRHPLGRTLVHATGWGGYMLFALPAVALAVEGRNLLDAVHLPDEIPGWTGAVLMALSLLVGATAAFEFATVGKGTPVPVDPPKRVVMTGPYAYVANPMQVTSAIVMALQAVPDRIDADAVRGSLTALPGVARVHDLHIWPMSTTESALTAHLVMPDGHPGDTFLTELQHRLSHDFGIDHMTVQIELGDGAECRMHGHAHG